MEPLPLLISSQEQGTGTGTMKATVALRFLLSAAVPAGTTAWTASTPSGRRPTLPRAAAPRRSPSLLPSTRSASALAAASVDDDADPSAADGHRFGVVDAEKLDRLYDLVVVGGGPAGVAGAIKAAQVSRSARAGCGRGTPAGLPPQTRPRDAGGAAALVEAAGCRQGRRRRRGRGTSVGLPPWTSPRRAGGGCRRGRARGTLVRPPRWMRLRGMGRASAVDEPAARRRGCRRGRGCAFVL